MVDRTKKSNNVYDIICYYNETQNQEETVNDVIESIENGKNNHENDDRNNNDVDKNKLSINVKLKLFACFLMNVLLSSPIYGFVAIYFLHKDKLDDTIALIWIPIIFNAIYLLVTPWLFNNTLISSTHVNRGNLSVIIIFTLIMSTAISLSGFIFAYLDGNFFLIFILYGVIGGMSSCVILGKMFVIINRILKNERLHLINFIYSFGTGMTQIIFPFLTHYVMQCVCHNCSILIIGAVITHIIPISMLLIGTENDEKDENLSKSRRSQFDMRKESEKNEESRYSDISSMSFHPEVIKYPSDVLNMDSNVQWKNPSSFGCQQDEKDDFLEILDNNRVMNSDGVEILETITEEDEENRVQEDVIRTAEQNNLTYEDVNKKFENRQQNSNRKLLLFKRFAIYKYETAFTVVYRQIINPLARSLKIFQFYPAVLLKSIDIFSYLLFVTFILPNQALKNFEENVIYLITLMGLCWIIYSISVVRFHKALGQNCTHYFHFIGLLAKFFGYLFTNQRYSFNGFIFGIVLISMGHANSFHLQETVIRNCFHPRQWFYIRGPIYSFSGFLILVYCITFHILFHYLSFVTFTNIFVLFNLCGILIWLLTNYEMVIYICSKY